MNFQALKSYLVERLQEPSTWRGFILMVTSLGVSISDNLQMAIGVVGVFVAGAIGAAFPDRGK